MAYDYKFTDLKYKPKKTDLTCTFKIKPAKGLTVEEAAEHVAAESSIGTWTEICTMKPRIIQKLRPYIYSIKGREAKIAYPDYAFEHNNMPQVYSSIAGNIFGMKDVDALRLEDFEFPEEMVNSFKGPQYGIEGVRRICRVKKRPLTGTIIKPKMGLEPKEHAKVAYEAWSGGLDVVKDDENLTSQKFNPFAERIVRTLEMADKAEEETGEKKIYLANVTAETKEALRRAEFVESQGGTHVMVDVLTCGFSLLQTLREGGFKLALHGHRAMHAAITRNPEHGISMLALAKSYRIIGLDQLHIGAIVGKMEGGPEEVLKIKDAIVGKMGRLKTTFPVCSGGLYPGVVPKLMKYMGNDVIIQAGGGVHGNPFGTEGGAKAMRDAVDAAMQHIPLKEYAQNSKELAAALKKWGQS